MIPPVESYTPTVTTAATQPLEESDSQSTNLSTATSQAQIAIDPQLALGLPQQEKSFSLKELNQLIKNITKMIKELSKLWNKESNNPASTNTLPLTTKSTIPTATTTQAPQTENWLTPLDKEVETIIPDIDGAPATAEAAIAPVNQTQPSATPNTGGMGIGTLNSEDPEVIPDLDPDLPPPPTGASKEYSIGTSLSRSGQFVWKPESDKDGKLAIVLPSRLTGKVKSVAILSPDKSKILAKGKFSGVANENREHFRFSKAGGGYPDNSIVMITMKDGKTYNVKIKESSDRYVR